MPTGENSRTVEVRDLLQRSMRIDTEGIGDGDPLFSAGLLDSFAMLELITQIESTFSIRINPENALMENLDSISGIANLVDECSRTDGA